MISDELKKIVDKFNEQGKMAFLPETTDDKISGFENKNNVTLPLQYKTWLRFSDGGEFFLPAGLQLYGVDRKPVIDVNDNDRPILRSFDFGNTCVITFILVYHNTYCYIKSCLRG